MKAFKNTLVIFVSVLSFSCTPDVVVEEVKSNLNYSELSYYPGGGDDDIVDETEKDDE